MGHGCGWGPAVATGNRHAAVISDFGEFCCYATSDSDIVSKESNIWRNYAKGVRGVMCEGVMCEGVGGGV